ncbi:MAG TPA: L-serine ammonia-lyase, iron-sulfur-dependent, subunit alpha [Sedimentibacter sp.]|uniref:L-cysteine desulfidase family protein n=1 Tax=Thermoclostridium caenicola TaxID=659425 RepID=UPI002C5B223A|nr:L-serine ammonia-lyase, iron-sulfur-dependent, subunit alpha [Thermoclostridium caenicola]HPO76122.1 L-serine ammonia-lyase, iron-sulfur-dependent, subunit alpha [Thermoclostridium caenicola]HQK54662.1 L-serine ammonia-lyase, iron-sulfur-dependent, subunit alpha [Sedimentibacter sp.]
MLEKDATLLSILKREIAPASGCTEPVAVAYSAAVARKKLKGSVEKLEVVVDGSLYKNGVRVGIPGIKERGLEIAAALGLFAGSPEKGLQVIENISSDALDKAKELVSQGKVSISVKEDCPKLFIETILHTSEGKVRVVTMDRHLNIVNIDSGEGQMNCEWRYAEPDSSNKVIQNYGLEDFLDFAKSVPLDEIAFLNDGIEMNLALAAEGAKMERGIGMKLSKLVEDGMIHENLMYKAQFLCSAASEARMSGSKLSAMSSAGSGNHGITVFLTNYAVAEGIGASREALLRALVISNLVTFYIKSYTGTLSAMCGCGVAAGIGASVGVVYLLGGSLKQMMGTILNMIGSIAGIICDGGKEGCSYKLALSAGWAVESALLALKGDPINSSDGILSADFSEVIKNMGYVCNPGMLETNKAIIKVMANEYSKD